MTGSGPDLLGLHALAALRETGGVHVIRWRPRAHVAFNPEDATGNRASSTRYGAQVHGRHRW
jgi:hypothetical protein